REGADLDSARGGDPRRPRDSHLRMQPHLRTLPASDSESASHVFGIPRWHPAPDLDRQTRPRSTVCWRPGIRFSPHRPADLETLEAIARRELSAKGTSVAELTERRQRVAS